MSNTLFRKVPVLILALFAMSLSDAAPSANAPGLWKVYDDALARAKYVDLTHTIAPGIPVWKGFGPSKFAPAVNPQTGQPYDYKTDGFAATHYDLSTDNWARSSTRRRIGPPNIPRSTNCQRPMRCAPSR